MPIIYSYPTSTDLLKSDILIGSSTRTVNGQKKNVTKNFSLEGIYTFLNETNAIAIAGQNNFFFQKIIAPIRQSGSISFAAGGGANTPFSSITTLRFSKYSTAGNIVLQYLQSLVGNNVILAQTDNLNNFSVYVLDSFTQVVGEPNFYDAVFTHVISNGNILEDKFYGFAFYSEVGGPSGIETVTGNIVDNTDPANPIVTQVQPDWDASSGLGEILNKPTIPTQTSDLTNDGDDGVNPFITAADVPVSDLQEVLESGSTATFTHPVSGEVVTYELPADDSLNYYTNIFHTDPIYQSGFSITQGILSLTASVADGSDLYISQLNCYSPQQVAGDYNNLVSISSSYNNNALVGNYNILVPTPEFTDDVSIYFPIKPTGAYTLATLDDIPTNVGFEQNFLLMGA